MENDTARVDNRKPRHSERLRDIDVLRTRKITTGQLRPGEIEELFNRLHAFHFHLAKLHEARTLDDLYAAAIAAAGALYDLKGHEVLYRRPDGRYLTKDGKELPADLLGSGDTYDDLIHWATQERRVFFYDIEDRGSIEINAIGVLPATSDPTRSTAIVLWVAQSLNRVNVLQIDMLQALARDLVACSHALMQAERMARLSSLFDNILESVPHAVIAISGDDHVIALNANAEFLFGIKRIFAIDEDYREAFPAKLAKTFRDLIDKSVMGGMESADAELELKLEGGVTVNIGISSNFLRDRTGRPQGHLFLCRDLSLSREVQKLRELDQMKSEFVNTVSHELKTPLTAILGGLEVLEVDADTLPDETREILGVVSDGAKRLRNLIFDLLDVSRLETGKVVLKEELTDIREPIADALRVQQPHPRHQLKVEVAGDVPKVMMDRAKIVQCLTNFVSNAIKYSPKGGDVIVRARVDKDKRHFEVSVQDQGLGLSPRNIDKVWQKFYRVDASYTSEIEGTGLGLSIVKKLVELHGGEVWIESVEGKGSTFFFSLPLRMAPSDVARKV